MEDKTSKLRWATIIAQVGRSPQSKKDARSLQNYIKKINRALDNMAPWTSEARSSIHRSKYGKQLQDSGKQVMVVLDGQDTANNPLYKNAHIAK